MFIAPCKVRPSEIDNGIMRFHGMNHGDRAKYRCNTGYTLPDHLNPEIPPGSGIKNNYAYITCLYGEWVGEDPYCEESRCRVFIEYTQ